MTGKPQRGEILIKKLSNIDDSTSGATYILITNCSIKDGSKLFDTNFLHRLPEKLILDDSIGLFKERDHNEKNKKSGFA